MPARPPASEVLEYLRKILAGTPGTFIAGSFMAACEYDKQDSWGDVDVWAASQYQAGVLVERLRGLGATLDRRDSKADDRWAKVGMGKWHTNAIKVVLPNDVEVNIIHKLADRTPIMSADRVVSVFDFGHLAVVYDCEFDVVRDARPFWFPGADLTGPLGLIPHKYGNWSKGMFSWYNGLREPLRLVKHHDYGYDMTVAAAQMYPGYVTAYEDYADASDEKLRMMGDIYLKLADLLRSYDIDAIRSMERYVEWKDNLSIIKESLE